MSKEGKKTINENGGARTDSLFATQKTYKTCSKIGSVFRGDWGKETTWHKRIADRFVYMLSALELFKNFAICAVFLFCENVR